MFQSISKMFYAFWKKNAALLSVAVNLTLYWFIEITKQNKATLDFHFCVNDVTPCHFM